MTIRRVLPMVLILLGIAFNIGCLIVPTFRKEGESWHDQHKPIDQAKLGQLKAGTTTVDDVVREMGTPSHRLVEGSLLVYSWSHPRQNLINFRVWVCGMKRIEQGDLLLANSGTIQHLLLHFDERGLLCESRVRTGGYVDSNATGMADAVKFATD
jgi:hypothetical protein